MKNEGLKWMICIVQVIGGWMIALCLFGLSWQSFIFAIGLCIFILPITSALTVIAINSGIDASDKSMGNTEAKV